MTRGSRFIAFENGRPVLAEHFDYDILDGPEVVTTPQHSDHSELNDILLFLAGDGSLEDIESRAILFLNIVAKKKLQHRPVFRIYCDLHFDWEHSAIASKLADYLLTAPTRRNCGTKATCLLFAYGRHTLATEPRNLSELADFCGVHRGCISKHIAKLEAFLGVTTGLRNNKADRLESACLGLVC